MSFLVTSLEPGSSPPPGFADSFFFRRSFTDDLPLMSFLLASLECMHPSTVPILTDFCGFLRQRFPGPVVGPVGLRCQKFWTTELLLRVLSLCLRGPSGCCISWWPPALSFA